MSITDYKITPAALDTNGVIAAPDTLTGSASNNKRVFDRLSREVVAPSLNGVIDTLAGTDGAANVGAAVDGVAGDNVQAVLDGMLPAVRSAAAAAAASADEAAAYARQAAAHTDLPITRGISGTNSMVMGDIVSNRAVDDYSHAEGIHTTASNRGSHAEGIRTTASGEYSHAEGGQTIASGSRSHAEGTATMASGNYSHAEGTATVASGNYSHAEGNGAKASGPGSHAEGITTTASGNHSHAEGGQTIASGNYSHAEGFGTKAENLAQHVFGTYNDPSTASGCVEIVGNGDLDSGTRSNARTLDWNGNEWLAGKLTMEGTPTADKDAATKKYVDDAAAALVPLVGKGVNLLDNAYFIGGGTPGKFPVNQRGDPSYGPLLPHGIDRWLNSLTGLSLTAAGIVISSTAQSSAFVQYVEEYKLAEGREHTLSILTNDLLFHWTFSPGKSSGWQPSSGWMGAFYPYCVWQPAKSCWELSIATNGDPSGATQSITIKAAKLELGSRQTLARQVNGSWVLNDPPPDYGEEMAKCQRYLHIIKADNARNLMIGIGNANASNSVYWDMTIPIMAKTPSLSAEANKIGIGTNTFTLNAAVVSLFNYSAGHASVQAAGFSGLTPGQPYRIALLDGGTMIFSAE